MSENRASSAGLDDGGGGDNGDPGGGAVCGPIENGIQLQTKDRKQPLASFTYAWAPTTEVAKPLDWTTVSNEDVQYNHIRCYELQEGDNLSEVVAKVNSNQCAQALILVNTEDSYHIDPKFLTGKEQLKLPILVLTSKSGKTLITALSQYPQNTEAKVLKFPIQVQSTGAVVDSSLTKTSQPATNGSDADGLIVRGIQDTQQLQQPFHQKPIENGLILKIMREGAPRYFTYAWSPTTERPQQISYSVKISDHAIEQFHIRCYQLTDENNDIRLLVTELEYSKAVALIIINNKDDYQIDSRFLPENEKWEFPIIVVTSGSGKILMEIIATHGRNVTAKVVSSVQILHTRETASEYAVSSPTPQIDKTWDMVRRIEDMMFPANSQPSIVSEDINLFQVVMSEFYVYETTEQSQETEKKVFALLIRKFQATFQKDFLFCIALAYRTCFLKHRHYRSKNSQEFVNLCYTKFEELEPVHVATALDGFFKRKDYSFYLGLKETPDPQQCCPPAVEVFQFIEHALNRLLKERKIKEYRIYPTMLWITTYLSFCAKRQLQESDEKIWQDYFLKDAHRYSLHIVNIEGLKKALALGQRLNLPPKVTFSTCLLGELFVPTVRIARPFYEQSNTVRGLEGYLSSTEEFMQHVVVRLREAYKQSLQQSDLRTFLNRVTDGTIPQAIKDGLLLLDVMLKVVHLKSLQFDEDFQEWILLLLSLTEGSSVRIQVECLREILSQRYHVTKRYHSYIMEKTGTRLKRLRVDRFYSVYTKCDPSSWPPEILVEYLDELKISLHTSISDLRWKCFFELVVAKFPGAANQRHIFKFLMRVADCYQENKRTYRSIVELMKLDVSGLFSVLSPDDKPAVTEFEDELRRFIHENGQKVVLISQTKEIMNYISVQKNSFQEIILAAVLKEMISDPKDLLQPSLSEAIDETITELCCREGHSTTEVMSWLQSEPSPKQMFCLDLVNACCTRISIFSNRFASIESVDWVMFDKYFYLITKVGTLYAVSASKQDQTTFPDVVTRNPSSSVRSYFEWIQKFHLMLASWKSRLQEKEANYEEINWYFKSHEYITNLAGAVAASSLVVLKKHVETLQDTFLEDFKKLNQLVLKYIPSDPKAGCCSVISVFSEYGAKFPQELQSEISANIIFPDEKERAATIECAELPSPIDDNFNPPTNTWLLLARQFSLNSLCQLIEQITAFLAPVEPSMDLLIYFKLYHSYLFSTHMRHVLSAIRDSATDESTPEQVHIAVNHVSTLLVKVLNGTATYGDIVKNFILDPEIFHVEEEFSTLLECKSLRVNGASTDLTGIKSLLKLIQFAEPILTFKQVFEQYDLECLNDPQINELALTLQDSEKRANIPIDDAIQKWELVHKVLCFKEDVSPKRLAIELFFKVADSADFYHFLREKSFVGTLGSAKFYHKVEVITQHQELDEYQQMVLNHLIAAFEFIAPIMDPSHELLHSLMSAVRALELPEGLPQLETVRKNMHLIQFWFSRSEDTPENVSSELNRILESGNFHIETTESDATVTRRSRLQLVLKYKLPFISTSESPTLSLDQSTPETQEQVRQEVVMTTEKIEDFVHKLKLLKAGDQNVQNFLHLNKVAYRLLEVFGKLQELGHLKLTQRHFKYTLDCSTLLPAVKQEVEYWEGEEGKWMEKVEDLHNSNKWLLFFRVPKLIVLYEALTAEKPSVPVIIHEIGFLFQRNAHTSEDFKSAVKVAVENCRQGSHSDKRSPMEIVGSFLDLRYLFDQGEVKKWALPVRYSKEYASLSQANNVLYNATGYTESELVRLILGLYGGPPEAFEFLHCEPTTTEQELRLLMKRAIQHPRLYLLAEVNNLPYQLQEVLLQLILQLKHQQTRVYFIETAPSLLREVSYLKFIDYKEGVSMDRNRTQTICKETGLCEDWSCIELVYGMPGTGKTHYIRNKMKTIPENHQVTIAINEAFTSVSAIERLRTLPRDADNCAIFFNFTIFPPMNGTDAREEEHYQQLMKCVSWFFFELLIIGYVEDPATGLSFHFPAGLSWALYTEVPSGATWKAPAHDHFLEWFEEQVPALALLGSPVYISPKDDYCIDEDVQLVCKFLRSYENGKIDRICGRRGRKKIKFSTDPRVSDAECKRLLQKYMSNHVKETKITQKLFIQYMKRRCTFLDNCPGFIYNTGYGECIVVDGKRQRTDTRHLGSTLMQTMLKEVTDFCDPTIKESWSQEAHQQLIYDFADGGGSFGLICLLPDDPRLQPDKERFKKMGVEIPSMNDLYSRAVLDKYLSRALGVPLSKDGRLSPIDERQYVLTLDYTLKMLNIHERYECGVPVIIEGETGVGKTALIEMLSELWNHSWIAEWNRDKGRIVDLMQGKMGDLETGTVDGSQYDVCVAALQKLGSGQMVTEEMWDTIAQLPGGRFEGDQFYSVLNQSLLQLEGDIKFAMLNLELNAGEKLVDVFTAIKTQQCSKTTAHLLYIIFSATVKSAFHKKNIHTDLQPMEIEEFFAEVILQADELHDAARRPQQLRVPSVTAYLDEINTASCLGLFKEIIVDRTINGKHIPENVFIIASCNPHRGDVLTIMHDKDHDSWLKGTYYVRKLHPTLKYLKWDYGSLNQQQEREYVNAKMKMLCQQSLSPPDDIVPSLSAVIVKSQQKMREYAFEQLQSLDIPKSADWLQSCAKSSVSQRDIQRVFTFYLWLMKTYVKLNTHNEPQEKYHRPAVLVSLGIVYFMRLNSKYRYQYRLFLDTYDQLRSDVTFSKAYKDELMWYINRIELPPNIAKTEALMENVFATIACTMTRTPLIIVGDPGSSKTLSFNIVATNLKGKESKIETYRHTDIFQSLDPHFYQCSHRTTSKEVKKTFKRAINRQQILTKSHLPILCVVFMDEAGLPEEKLESLKVLHYYLDKPEVSFVAISNHILDASKTNRAVSLFRPKPTHQELHELAEASIFPAKQVPSMIEGILIEHFCNSYQVIVCHKKLKKLFGLRDFIYFVIYLRCNRKYLLDAQLIIKALERNFNGSESFEDICKIFFEKIPAYISMERIHFRSILDILKDSQVDHAISEGDDIHKSIQSEVRYKLIIDPSEDDSLVRLLFTYGVLRRKDTQLFICSDFTGDSRSRVNTVVQIMHSVAAGHTILMCQTDEIHESFYDLFNQRFRSIKDPKHGTRYYTNITIGAHSKLCRVNPAFRCIVVIKKSEVEDTPPPFLNRFEKYYLTHRSLLETVLSKMPPNLSILLEAAHKKAAKFISCVKQPNLYGCTEETLDSLLLMLLPTDHKYTPLQDQQDACEESEHIGMFFLKLLLKMLRENAGFHIPKLLAEEVEEDAIYIFDMVLQNPEFERALAGINYERVAVVIDEALYVLHQPTDTEVHPDALMVIAVLMQWFVSYLCKKLMQLVPPEAIPVHCGGIPTMYIRNYLKFQEHFSLKVLIDRQLEQLQGNDWDRSVCPTELLCFTRSSPLIHQLPTEYPATATATTRAPSKHVENLVREHIFTNLDLLSICKVSLGHSQDKLEKILSSFATSKHQVLLLIANMQELTKRMVNHLRIMIEEAESRMDNKSKLFVLLLHFPPLMFFNPCYPSLFLQGWSHHYLDAIACGTLTREGVKSVVDINRCFYHCCFSDSLSDPKDEEGQMLEALNELFPEAIPIIASRVAFTRKSNGNTFELNASQRTELLQQFFNTNTGENNCSGGGEGRDSIAQILTAKFCKYWTPELMVQQIDQVSRSMYAQDSTLNITDSIQSIVRAAFFDFLVCMFTRISEDHSIDVRKDGSPVVCGDQLFLTLLREIRVPELAQFKSLSATIGPQQEHKKAKCILKFPFFKYVCEILDKVIDESREDVKQQFDIEKPSASLRPTQKKTKHKVEMLYKEVVMARIQKNKLQGCLGVTTKAMDDEQGDTIRRQYFDDFVAYKLDLDSEPSPLTREIIEAYISPLKTMCSDSLSQMVSLHVYFHVHHLDLTKVTSILSHINRVEKEMATLPRSTVPAATLSTFSMEHEDIKSASRMPPSLGSLIVTMLFDFISNIDAATSESLQCWYRSYHDIMSVPAMVENVLSNLNSLHKTQLSIMHATYLLMDLSPQRGYPVFTALQSAQCVRLREVVTTALQTMKGASSVQLDEEGYCLQSFLEGLFSFFFSEHRVLFDEEDCEYFLELTNKPHSVSTTQIMGNCLSINMLKLYLARILGEPEQGTSSQTEAIAEAGPTELFPLNYKYREMVGKVLAAQSDLGSPGPYIPTVYQLKEMMHIHSCEASKNALMQQPLAHLYFLTVFELLQTRKYQSNHLVRLAEKISVFLQKDSTQNVEKILLFIEKQAVVQMLIYEVAAFFDPKDPSKLHDLFNTKLNERVNPLFTDEAMGGSRNRTCVSWHALVFAMHLQKQLNNPWELVQLLSDDTSSLVKDFRFMKPLQTLIQFAEHRPVHAKKLFHNISCLESHYPHFPTMDEFTHTILSSDINSAQHKLYVLSIFALEHCHLQAAGSLLPDLLKLYHWIHNELAYLVTYEDARSDTIEDVIEKYGGLELTQLYARVRDGYNSYVEMVGHYTGAVVKGKEGANKMRDSTKFVDFLSAKTDDEQWEGSDLLYLVTNDIINFHNSFLQRVFDAVSSSEHSSLRKYFPEKLGENVYSTEVNEDVMIIPRQSPKDYEVEELLQIVRSRYLQPTEQRSGVCPFDLHRLQIDVIQAYLAGKPQLTGNRICFRFKIERPNTLALEGADLDLSVISQSIKEEFKLQLEEEYASQLLYEFHSADYQLLAEVVRGLRVATEHLKSKLIGNEAEFESKKLPEFLLSVFKELKTGTLEDIGIKNLSSSQLTCLRALELPYLYSTMELFVNWVKDGMYDFHQLPFVMKKCLEPLDEEVLDMLDTNYTVGTVSELLQGLQLLTDNLVRSESHLKKTIVENMKKSITVVLKEDKGVEKSELIPDTVLCQHYVALRVMLRRKTVDLQTKLNAKGLKHEDQGIRWVEQVEDLWTAKLKRLWDVAKLDYSDHTFQFDPGAGEYGLYGYHWELLTPSFTEEEEEKKPEPEAPPSTPVRKEQLEEVAKQLSVADITEFLKTVAKLEQYTALFEENDIDGAILFTCTKEILKDLGIANTFHCTKIMTKFGQYLQAKSSQ